MAISVVSFSFSWCSTGGPGAQLSAECWLSLPHLVTNRSPSLLGAPRAPSARSGFPYHILSAISLVPNSSGAPRAPSAGLSLPHLISNFSGPQLSDFLSSQSYIIVQRPLNLWKGMFDCHQVEITVMMFRGHSLPLHQSMSVSWAFYLVPFHQPNPPTQSLSITGHWNVSLPSGASLWNGMFARAEGQNTTVQLYCSTDMAVAEKNSHFIIYYLDSFPLFYIDSWELFFSSSRRNILHWLF